eukprot:TRINITY_DN26243_c0_g1_i1.p1 TRINITY_DN26243_c0_g1~~TRINITY_DN26243_c0_g1_i1.p1  ORF type:complete len:308 (+),score=66.27 TRINITY_DN26243_c0_g1_i1:61-984(+)
MGPSSASAALFAAVSTATAPKRAEHKQNGGEVGQAQKLQEALQDIRCRTGHVRARTRAAAAECHALHQHIAGLSAAQRGRELDVEAVWQDLESAASYAKDVLWQRRPPPPMPSGSPSPCHEQLDGPGAKDDFGDQLDLVTHVPASSSFAPLRRPGRNALVQVRHPGSVQDAAAVAMTVATGSAVSDLHSANGMAHGRAVVNSGDDDATNSDLHEELQRLREEVRIKACTIEVLRRRCQKAAAAAWEAQSVNPTEALADTDIDLHMWLSHTQHRRTQEAGRSRASSDVIPSDTEDGKSIGQYSGSIVG